MPKDSTKNNPKNTGKDMAKDKPLDEKVKKLMAQDRAEKARFKHLKINFRENRFGPLIFAVLFAGLGAIFIFTGSAAPQKATPVSNVKMWLLPASQQVAIGSVVTTEIWVDSDTQPVNAAQASLTYPVDRLEFAGIDTTTSGFGISAESSGASGKISVVRGSTEPLTGKQLVAKVNFKALARGNAKVNFTKQSQLLRTTDNVNVLSSMTGAQYSVSD